MANQNADSENNVFKSNNEHYDIDMSDKIIFCKDRSIGYNFKKNGTQDLFPSFSRTDCFK